LLANTAAMTEFLPEALALYLANHPHIDIDLNERLSTETVRAVAGGVAEIGIVSDAVHAGTLQLLPFALDHLVLVVPSGHPLAGAKCIDFRDITEQAFVGLTRSSALQEHIDEQRLGVPHAVEAPLRPARGGRGLRRRDQQLERIRGQPAGPPEGSQHPGAAHGGLKGLAGIRFE
jgi:DNA-binding transcriptional LysR family regulator